MEYNQVKIDGFTKPVQIDFRLNGLDCANCAAQIESEIMKLESVDKAFISLPVELLTLKLSDTAGVDSPSILKGIIQSIIDRIEPGVKVEEVPEETKSSVEDREANRNTEAVIDAG